MEKREYNGWYNYETWLANLWQTNDSGSCEYWEERARECLEYADCSKDNAASSLADEMEAEFDECCEAVGMAGLLADLLNAAGREINWREIADHYMVDITVYVAGWNMPGYMPDNPPSAFLDADDALEYVRESAKEAMPEDLSDEQVEEWTDGVDSWKADKNGEFGVTLGDYHYFVSIGE